jgi:hypothetical protein
VRALLLTERAVEIAFPGYGQGHQFAHHLVLPSEDHVRHQELDAEEQLVEVNPAAETLKLMVATLNGSP